MAGTDLPGLGRDRPGGPGSRACVAERTTVGGRVEDRRVRDELRGVRVAVMRDPTALAMGGRRRGVRDVGRGHTGPVDAGGLGEHHGRDVREPG